MRAMLDPITLEILWSRLISIADESAAALLRTSFSTIVRESNDYATVLMDANGDALAENTAGIPSFVGILPRTLKHMLVRFPVDTWRPGDQRYYVTNSSKFQTATGWAPQVAMNDGISQLYNWLLESRAAAPNKIAAVG